MKSSTPPKKDTVSVKLLNKTGIKKIILFFILYAKKIKNKIPKIPKSACKLMYEICIL